MAVLDYSYNFGDDHDPLADVAILALDGVLAYDEDYTASYKTILADAGVYQTAYRTKTTGMRGLVFDDIYDLNLQGYSTPNMKSSPKMPIFLPHLTVTLKNEDDFLRMPGGVAKAERVWHEEDVSRDELGRFSEENKARMNDDVLERMERRKRRQRRKSKRLASTQSETSDLVTALMARQSDPAPAVRQVTREKMVDDLQEQRIDALAERMADRAAQRRLDRALARNAERQKDLEGFRFEHEEWKNLKAVKFSNEDDLGTFTEIFDYDPYTGKDLALGGVVNDADRMDAVNWVLGQRLKNSQDVMEGIFHNPGNPMIGLPQEAAAIGSYESISVTPWTALGWAQAAADELNAGANDPTREWMPFVQMDDEHRNFVMYRPMVVETVKRDEDVVVLGSESDWAAVRRGDKVSLEPLAGFDEDPNQPGQGRFKQLLYAVGTAETVDRDVELHEKSDFYVRAFRIRK
jgi:hypothetical protein